MFHFPLIDHKGSIVSLNRSFFSVKIFGQQMIKVSNLREKNQSVQMQSTASLVEAGNSPQLLVYLQTNVDQSWKLARGILAVGKASFTSSQ